jgi:SAM-dependent methyltransferase
MGSECGAQAVNDFGAIADVYDELVDWAPYEEWVAGLEPRLVRRGLARGARLLDVACGTGLSTLPWLERGYRVVGVDASATMLARCRRRIEGAGYRAELLCQDVLHLAPGGPFDAAVCMHSGLDYLLDEGDLAAAFRSLRGCLARGGLLAFDKCLDEPVFYRRDYRERRDLSCGRVEFHYHWDRSRRLMEQRCTVVRTRGRGPARTDVLFQLRSTPPDELVAMVEDAGFKMLEPLKQFIPSDPGMGIFRAV